MLSTIIEVDISVFNGTAYKCARWSWKSLEDTFDNRGIQSVDSKYRIQYDNLYWLQWNVTYGSW